MDEKTDDPKLRRATSVVSPWTWSMKDLYAPGGSRLAPDNVAEPVKGVPVSKTSGIGKVSEVLHSARPSGIARGAHRHRAHIMHLPHLHLHHLPHLFRQEAVRGAPTKDLKAVLLIQKMRRSKLSRRRYARWADIRKGRATPSEEAPLENCSDNDTIQFYNMFW